MNYDIKKKLKFTSKRVQEEVKPTKSALNHRYNTSSFQEDVFLVTSQIKGK